MNLKRTDLILLFRKSLVVLGFLFLQAQAFTQVVKTEIAKVGGNYTFLRNGEPYYVNGAGGHTFIDELKKCGGNSIRTWSLEDAEEILDMAHKNGLTVMMGLWVGHERHGFDYNDEAAIAGQLKRFTEAVPKFKDHPALLCWGVGNEVDLFYSNTKVWDAIQDIAKMIHELDGNHPTTTVTAGLDPTEVKLIMEKCPDIDFYGVNTYGELSDVPDNLVKYGWNGPYMITEWGPNGHWEVEKTKWGAPYEQTSKEKADVYAMRYQKYIKDYRSRCMGSYVFLWGQKQETTSTWYGLFTEDGDWTSTVDNLQIAWSGNQPANLAPLLTKFKIDDKLLGTDVVLKSNSKYTAMVNVEDPEQGKMRYKWMILPESTDIKAGGDTEKAPPPIIGLYSRKKGNTYLFEPPMKEGAYRLFVFVYDKEGKVAYANFPFFVEPGENVEQKAIQIKKQTLDL